MSTTITRRCQETGFTVTLEPGDDGGWHIICDEHGFNSEFRTQADALRFLSHPKSEGWCEICSGSYVPSGPDDPHWDDVADLRAAKGCPNCGDELLRPGVVEANGSEWWVCCRCGDEVDVMVSFR